jgi:hypothetical protein
MAARLSIREISERLAADAADLARELLGEPNRRRSSRSELRFGGKGSLAIEIAGKKRGEWYDHEAGKGGGAFGLVQHVRKCDMEEARAYALSFLRIQETEPAPVRQAKRPSAPPLAEPSEDGTEPESEPESKLAAGAKEIERRFLSRSWAASESGATALYLRRHGYRGAIPEALRNANLPYYSNGGVERDYYLRWSRRSRSRTARSRGCTSPI